MMLIGLALWQMACQEAPPEAVATPAEAVPVVAAPEPAVSLERLEEVERDLKSYQATLSALDERLADLEIAVADLEHVGIGRADRVTYDPSRTRLDGRTVQAAIDDLVQMIQQFQGDGEPMGQPGSDLFRMHEEDGPMGGSRLAPGGSRGSKEQSRPKGKRPDGPPPPP